MLPLRGELVDEQAGDEVAGQDEEHVDADEAAGHPSVPEVKNRITRITASGADPVEMRAIAVPAGELRGGARQEAPPR